MTSFGRIGIALVFVAGCNGAVARRDQADTGEDLDAAIVETDASTGSDAFTTDDAFVTPGMDAWSASDMGSDAYALPDATWGACMAGGVMGTCMSVSACTGGSMPIMGLCPGPSDIQCCLPGHDAGMGTDGGMVTPAQVLTRLGACTHAGGNYSKDVGTTANIAICQTDAVFWWTADFDVDCDGGSGAVCRADPDYMPDTSAVDSHGHALDASTLPFIVIPLGSTRFRYSDHAIAAGQIALVLYQDRMAWGIFGDAGPAAIIGEGSYAMAQALGIPPSPSTGGVDSGVTYLVFSGTTSRVAHNEDHAAAVSQGQTLLNAFLTH